MHSIQLPESAIQQGDNGKHFFPTKSDDEGRLILAPYSLRKIEAALLEYGFTEDEVIIADPRKLDSVIGPETKAIGLTVHDPLGYSAVSQLNACLFRLINWRLASALLANAVFMGQMLWANHNPDNQHPVFSWIGQFEEGAQDAASPTGGILYYLIPPRSLDLTVTDPIRGLVYVITFTAIVTVFSRLWVELGGLSARTAAKNLLAADVQVPGFRRSEGSVEMLLNKYIPSLTIISGIIVGLLASLSDILHLFGSGTGLLLMVNIMVTYYQTLVKEKVDTHLPSLAGLLGRK